MGETPDHNGNYRWCPNGPGNWVLQRYPAAGPVAGNGHSRRVWNPLWVLPGGVQPVVHADGRVMLSSTDDWTQEQFNAMVNHLIFSV